MIFYVCFYSNEYIKNENRLVSPAANNKTSYIIDALSSLNEDIKVVSMAETTLSRFVRGGIYKLNDNTELITFASMGGKFKAMRGLGHLLTRIKAFFYLICNVKKEDVILTYHSLFTMKLVASVKRIKKCNLCTEVEEIYADVKENDALRNKELKYLKRSDNFIFITELLERRINFDNKPYTIAHGSYKYEEQNAHRFDDGKVHIVYAGTLSKVKGGAYIAIKTAKYLDENYIIEVLGGGNESEITAIRAVINQMNKENKCKIEFVGYKSGADFNSFIQGCDVGLSTQSCKASFNDTSFPSKILMYLSNRIKVVSVRIPAVETSKVANSIYYYDGDEPKNIAEAIRRAASDNRNDETELLNDLNRDFVNELYHIIG